MQNLRLPSLFWTNTTMLAHGLHDFWMVLMLSISWRLAFSSSCMWRVFTSSSLWKVSSQSTQSDAWWGTSFQGPGHCRQTGFPILSTAPLLPFAHFWVNHLDPGDLTHLGSSFLGATGRSSWGSHWKGYCWHLVGWSDFPNNHFGWHHSGVSTQVPQADQYLGGSQVQLPISGGWHNWSGQLGVSGWLCRHMEPHTVPSDVFWPWIFMVSNGGMVTYCVVWMHLWALSRQNPLCAVGTEVVGGSVPFLRPHPLMHLRGNWSDPDMTTLKWACLKVMVALASTPFVIIPIALSIILDSTMTSTFSI